MEPKMQWVANNMPKSADEHLPIMAAGEVAKARAFHEGFPQYEATSLAKLDGMAGHLGLGGLFVKDESYRFGLNAFKVLVRHGALHRRTGRKGCGRLRFRVLDEQQVAKRLRTGDLLHRNRRESRPRRGVGGQPLGAESRRSHAEGQRPGPLR